MARPAPKMRYRYRSLDSVDSPPAPHFSSSSLSLRRFDCKDLVTNSQHKCLLFWQLTFDPVVTSTSLLERVTGGNGREQCRTLLPAWQIVMSPRRTNRFSPDKKARKRKIATQPLIAFRHPSVCPETFESLAEPRPVHNAKGQARRAGYFSDDGMLFAERKCHNDADYEQGTCKYVKLE